jgi:hypothetical protein
MPETDDNLDPLAPLLRDHLAAKLDRHVGKSRAAFLAYARNAGSPASGRVGESVSRPAAPTRRGLSRWTIGIASIGSLAAAAVVAFALLDPSASKIARPSNPSNPSNPTPGGVPLAMGPGRPAPSNTGSPGGPPVVAVANTVPVEQTVTWDTVDGGTLYGPRGVPVRGVRRERVDQIRFVDPRLGNAKVEITLPRDEVTLVGMQAH